MIKTFQFMFVFVSWYNTLSLCWWYYFVRRKHFIRKVRMCINTQVQVDEGVKKGLNPW